MGIRYHFNFMRLLAILLALSLVSCASRGSSYSELHSQDVTLPNGQVIQVETMISREDQMRGMMFRTSLPPNRGMLYVHQDPGVYSYWTYQYEIPLDMIWMDTSHIITEMIENVPPCHSKASECPHYGGAKVARYHLELAGGMARKYGLKPGQRLEF